MLLFLYITDLISKIILIILTYQYKKNKLCISFQVPTHLLLMFCMKETKLTFRWGYSVRFEYNRRVFNLVLLLFHRYSSSVRFCLTCRLRSTNVFKPRGILIAELFFSFVESSLSFSAFFSSAFGWESHLHPWQSGYELRKMMQCVLVLWKYGLLIKGNVTNSVHAGRGLLISNFGLF